MKNKIAALVAGTILSSTVGTVPSYALNSQENFADNAGTNSEKINLDNDLNQIGDRTATKQIKTEHGEVLITRNRYRRRNLRRRRRRNYRRFRNRVINRGRRRRIYQRMRRPVNRRTWQITRPKRRPYYR